MNGSIADEEHAPPGLLHHLSARSVETASRQGVHRTRLVRIPVRSALALHRAAGAGPRTLCARVGVKPARGQSAEEALAAWVERQLDAVDFPPVAAVLPENTVGAHEIRRAPARLLAIAIAVATRSTGKVFLRAKTPLWSRLHASTTVVLALPEDVLGVADPGPGEE